MRELGDTLEIAPRLCPYYHQGDNLMEQQWEAAVMLLIMGLLFVVTFIAWLQATNRSRKLQRELLQIQQGTENRHGQYQENAGQTRLRPQ